MNYKEAQFYFDGLLTRVKNGTTKSHFYNTLYYNHKDGSRSYLNNCIVENVDDWFFIVSEHNGSLFLNKEDILEMEYTINYVEPEPEAEFEEDYNEADFEDYVTSYEEVLKSGNEDRLNHAEASIEDQMEH